MAAFVRRGGAYRRWQSALALVLGVRQVVRAVTPHGHRAQDTLSGGAGMFGGGNIDALLLQYGQIWTFPKFGRDLDRI